MTEEKSQVGEVAATIPFISLQGDLDSFIKHFEATTKGFDVRDIATSVWILANEQWNEGKRFALDEDGDEP